MAMVGDDEQVVTRRTKLGGWRKAQMETERLGGALPRQGDCEKGEQGIRSLEDCTAVVFSGHRQTLVL